MTFGEDKRPVPSVDFDYDEIDGKPCSDDSAETELALVRAVLSILLENHSRRDALPSRLAAFGYLIRHPGFCTYAEASQRSGLSERSIRRAVSQLRKELSGRLKIEQFSKENQHFLTVQRAKTPPCPCL